MTTINTKLQWQDKCVECEKMSTGSNIKFKKQKILYCASDNKIYESETGCNIHIIN